MAWGLLLINLGTPDSTSVPDVRRYLDEFLMDPRVIDISDVGRWALVKLAILPFRPAKSAEAYRAIWGADGSPLLRHTERLRDAVADLMQGEDVHVEFAMRYQNPSIASALDRFRAAGIDNVVVFPLFPQYASASTGSAVQKVWEEASARWNVVSLANVPAFYDDPRFVGAFASVARPVLDAFAPDHVLISFHGVPERHVTKSDESPGQKHCLADGCCDAISSANRNCYRAQCYATARALVASLGLCDDKVDIAFQSRLGRDPWVRPYTDEVIVDLAKRGVRRLAVFCPAFTADCLETIEEIGMRGDAEFRAAGGEALQLVPSLNSHPEWARAVATIAAEQCPPAWRGR